MAIVHAPCVVQGPQAPAEITAALRRLSAHPLVDVIICGRGGGSLDDLMAFNDESVVRAIAACPVPVVSAVGHETDWTLADLVADVRAKTPTAAGELVVPVAAELRAALAEQRSRLDRGIDRLVEAARQRLAALSAHRALASPGHQIALRRQRLDDLVQRLDGSIAEGLRRCRERLGLAAGRLAALSPLAVLGRGYAVVESSGRILRGIADAPPGATITARLNDGWLDAEVTSQRPLPG
jgi:exodeoxyribonuclease VII large subunit